jgi:hypothetical protein
VRLLDDVCVVRLHPSNPRTAPAFPTLGCDWRGRDPYAPSIIVVANCTLSAQMCIAVHPAREEQHAAGGVRCAVRFQLFVSLTCARNSDCNVIA